MQPLITRPFRDFSFPFFLITNDLLASFRKNVLRRKGVGLNPRKRLIELSFSR